MQRTASDKYKKNHPEKQQPHNQQNSRLAKQVGVLVRKSLKKKWRMKNTRQIAILAQNTAENRRTTPKYVAEHTNIKSDRKKSQQQRLERRHQIPHDKIGTCKSNRGLQTQKPANRVRIKEATTKTNNSFIGRAAKGRLMKTAKQKEENPRLGSYILP